ncbi:BrnA antitoxin family protein [Paraburkholderia agricolaris]|nr:BrnA antitoxin family protein [Paraburkholderia agricolaris]
MLNRFKEQGAGYQTRINKLLRAYMLARSAVVLKAQCRVILPTPA